MIRDIRIKKWSYNNKDLKKNDIVRVLDVDYIHLRLEDKSDIYVTAYGLPFIENLKPKNFWTDELWFKNNSERLPGTSSVYKVRTKKVTGKHKDIVVKWNRMGQGIPGADEHEELINANFNSPFEEFSLVSKLKDAMRNSSKKIVIQKPLAIYVPSELNELWQTGRTEYKMQSIIKSHKEIELDMRRLYAVIYEWIEGIDAKEASDKGLLDEKHMRSLTIEADESIKKKGFIVRDSKPHHVIVKPKNESQLVSNRDGDPLYALIDFELLEMTQKQDEILKKAKRIDYHKRQKDRFSIDIPKKFHPHLSHVNFFGVDYIFGHVESTNGRLWVVGKDPYLFDYFLPERWEKTNRMKISMFSESYYTVTEDNIHIVWEVSKVGLCPDKDPFKEDEKKILEHGYNSPFEEVKLAVKLNASKIINTIYPRAIYMMGSKTRISDKFFDKNRYNSHKKYIAPDNIPILKKDHEYVIIWGYWNGPDEKLAARDGDYYEGINSLRAYREGVITEKEYISLLQVAKEKLAKVGVEDLNLRGDHLLISLDADKRLVRDTTGKPEIRICNFEFLKEHIK
ncbi:MAG: hypothetical protein ABIG92_05920 [Candidatus Omnitrophota bacterium]